MISLPAIGRVFPAQTVLATQPLLDGLSSQDMSEGSPLTLCQVHLVDQSRKDMPILDVVVIVRSEDIGGDHSGESAAVLLKIPPGRRRRERRGR